MSDVRSLSPTRAVTHRVGRFRPGRMRLWTLQPLQVWECLSEQGTLWSDPIGTEAFEEAFRDSYDWMRGQLRRRLMGYEGRYP